MQDLLSQSQSRQQPLHPHSAQPQAGTNSATPMQQSHLHNSGFAAADASPWPRPDSHHFEPIGNLTYQMLELHVGQNAPATAEDLLWLACTIADSAALDSRAADLQMWVQQLTAADRSDYWQGYRDQQQPSDASASQLDPSSNHTGPPSQPLSQLPSDPFLAQYSVPLSSQGTLGQFSPPFSGPSTHPPADPPPSQPPSQPPSASNSQANGGPAVALSYPHSHLSQPIFKDCSLMVPCACTPTMTRLTATLTGSCKE